MNCNYLKLLTLLYIMWNTIEKGIESIFRIWYQKVRPNLQNFVILVEQQNPIRSLSKSCSSSMYDCFLLWVFSCCLMILPLQFSLLICDLYFMFIAIDSCYCDWFCSHDFSLSIVVGNLFLFLIVNCNWLSIARKNVWLLYRFLFLMF